MIVEPVPIYIDPIAWDQMKTAAGLDVDVETGGILLGWREERGLCVTQMLEVYDNEARRTSYTRRQRLAQKLMNEILDVLPADTSVGYVGEWHVHPAPIGPSITDQRELKRLSKKSKGSLGLIVCARELEEAEWRPHGLLGINGHVVSTEVQIQEVVANGSE
jgi:integrative and conjugative element protein (TIGR02256 family)